MSSGKDDTITTKNRHTDVEVGGNVRSRRSVKDSIRSFDAKSVISSPSDEMKAPRQPQPPPQQQLQPPHKQVEEGYHSVPESGNAMNVGYTSSRNNNSDSNTNNDYLQIHNKNSGGTFITAMEQEHSSKQDNFEDDYNTSQNNSSRSETMYGSKQLKQMATDAGTLVWKTLLSGTDPVARRKTFVQACYLGIAAIFGTLLRLILAQLFGQACSNPGTIGWIADEAVLCVTRDGTTTQNEGIVFADLPANLLGSFVMGLLQDGTALGLAINVPIAFLSPSNPFQSFDIWHLALKTGFCGSLTTFSAWNSEMVILMLGRFEKVVPNQQTMIWKAFFGYIIGMETAIGSYVFGRTVAWWLHQWVNPELALEQKEMNIRETRHGIAINRELPLVERRYLHGLSDNGNANKTDLTQDELAPLRSWRESTRESRRVESGVSEILVALETALIARKEVLSDELRNTALSHDWDINGLQEWLSKRNNDVGDNYEPISLAKNYSLTAAGVSQTLGEDDTVWYAAPAAALLLSICLMVLVVLILNLDDKTSSYEITYRTMAYSMLFAAPGALLRWKLSSWNGKLGDLVPRFQRMAWLPIGTLAANVLGAMISICMIGWEFNLEMGGATNFWGIATVRAIKIGFSGCLSTVSTFVSEVHKLTKIRIDRGYKYILITLVLSAVTSMILFVIVV